jgi:hypothetical protein
MARDIIDRALASTEAREARLVRHRYQVDAARQIASTVQSGDLARFGF